MSTSVGSVTGEEDRMLRSRWSDEVILNRSENSVAPANCHDLLTRYCLIRLKPKEIPRGPFHVRLSFPTSSLILSVRRPTCRS